MNEIKIEDVPKLTPEQASIVSAYTGYLVGDFGAMHAYIEQKMGGPVWTHQMGDAAFYERIREATKADFVALAP